MSHSGTSASAASTARAQDAAHGPLQFGLSRAALLSAGAAFGLFLILALVLAATRPPQSDEGHFASAGAALAFQGRFVMPMWTPWISTLDQRVYSNMPLYFLTLGAWFKVFGLSWMTFRILSVLFGVALVVALMSILRSVSRERATLVAGLVLLVLNYDIVNLSSARYDVMAGALNAGALAFYLHWRERSFDKAVLVANTLLAAACLTHPFALFGMVGFATFVLMLDWRAIRLRHFALAAAPYLVALAAWGVYIAKDPDMFRAQFAENANGRLQSRLGLLDMIGAEIRIRYLDHFAGWRPGVTAAMRVKTLLLVAYLVGIVGCVALRPIRSNPKARALLVYTLLAVVLLMFADANRWYVYLLYVIPLLAMCLALFTGELIRMGGWQRTMAYSGLAAFALFTVASVAYRARLDVHHRAYLPTVRYLQSQVRDGDLVIAGGEFGVGLDFDKHVLDDPMIGYTNRKVPRFFVLSPDGRATFDAYAAADPRFRAYADTLMATYRPVFRSVSGHARYEVFARAADPAPATVIAAPANEALR